MTSSQLQNEVTYQVTMMQARQLWHDGFISDESYHAFKAKMMEKYFPIISRLSAL